MILFIVFVCLFFFFKQKTAYEMRISDWSSDVCSSDLKAPARMIVPGKILRVASAPLEWLARDRLMRFSFIDQVVASGGNFVTAILLARALGIYEQIGRTSCRERVCQYV